MTASKDLAESRKSALRQPRCGAHLDVAIDAALGESGNQRRHAESKGRLGEVVGDEQDAGHVWQWKMDNG